MQSLYKNLLHRNVATILFFLLFATTAFAQTISIQGVLREPNGRSVDDGAYSVTFKIYDVANDGAALWTDTYTSLQTRHGVFEANLGDQAAPLDVLSFDREYFVGITVENYGEMSPRIALTIYPYAKSVLGADNQFPSVGNVVISAGNLTLGQGSLTLEGDITSNSGALSLAGDITTTTGALSVAGPITSSAGGLSVAGDIATSNGALSLTGDITTTTGALSVAGPITSSAGGITVDGNIKTNNGSLIFADGTSLSSANLGGSAGSLANDASVVINADGDANGSGTIDFLIGGTDVAKIKQPSGIEGSGLMLYKAPGYTTPGTFWKIAPYLDEFHFTQESWSTPAMSIVSDGRVEIPYLLVNGDINALHTRFIPGVVQAFSDASNVGSLSLNPSGGRVEVGFSGLIAPTLFGGSDAAGVVYMNHDRVQAVAAAGGGGTLHLNPDGGVVQVGIHGLMSPQLNAGTVAGGLTYIQSNRIQTVVPGGGDGSTLQLNPDGGAVTWSGDLVGPTVYASSSVVAGLLNGSWTSVSPGQINAYQGQGPSVAATLTLNANGGGVLVPGGLAAGPFIQGGNSAGLHTVVFPTNIQARNGGSSSNLYLNYEGGNVLIGAPNATEAAFAKLVVSGNNAVGATFPLYRYLDGAGVQSYGSGNGDAWTSSLGIYAPAGVGAGGFYVVSDERVKNIKQRSNTADDLAKINELHITDYDYIDKVQNGNKQEKKLIAQEVRTVYPQAVTLNRNFVPSIYAAATKTTFSEESGLLTVKLKDAHDLAVGDKVKVMTEEGEVVKEVVSVTNDKTFKVASQESHPQLFVYGKEVDDFHIIDYDAISMLNVSATQELTKQNEKQQKEIDALKAENAKLKSRLGDLAALEAKVDILLGLDKAKNEAAKLVGQQ
jgi:hypothetical protein